MTPEQRQAWLLERRKGIGSSDCAAICGLSPWASALEIYLRKLGELPEAPESPAMRWGTLLEPAVAEAYQQQTGIALSLPARPICQHREHPWMLASLDRQQYPGGKPVELKTASAYAADEWGEPGTDQVPEHYLLQVQHQLAVCGGDEADVAVLIGGSDFRVYTVRRREDVIASLIQIEADFWHRVEWRCPPPPDWSHPSTPALVQAMHGLDPSMHVELGSEALDLADSYQQMGQNLRDIGKWRDETKARLLHLMGDAALGHLPDGRKVRRHQITRKAYEVAEATYVDFRILAPKEKSLVHRDAATIDPRD